MLWAKLVLFCYPVPKNESDPNHIKKRLILIYGEGHYTSTELSPNLKIIDKGRVYIIKWAGDYDLISKSLQAEYIDNEPKGLRLTTGLLRRPAILAANNKEYTLPFPLNSSLDQYVYLDKENLLRQIWAGDADPIRRLTLVDEALDSVGAVSGRAFRGGEHHLLGDVFLVERVATKKLPIAWKYEDTPEGEAEIHVDVDAAAMPCSQAIINFRVSVLDCVIDDRVIYWSRGGSNEFTINFNQPFNGVDLKVWTDQRLRWEYSFVVNPGMSIVFENAHSTVHIRDRLTERASRSGGGAKSGKSRLNSTGSSVMKYGKGLQSLIPGGNASPWKDAAAKAKGLPVSLFRPAPPPDTLFSDGNQGRLGLVESMAARISKASRAVLIDPFFDSLGAETLLSRIANQSVDFSIITSLPDDINPALFKQLQEFLQSPPPSLHSNTRIFRLTKGKDQAFHDRYLIVFNEFPQPTVFNLTNSVSGLALNFPLVVTALPAQEAGAVYSNICEPIIIDANATEPIWPLETAEKKQRSQLERIFQFPKWENFLEDFLPQNGRPVEAWLQQAISHGLMVNDHEIKQWRIREYFSVAGNAARLKALYVTPLKETPTNRELWASWRTIAAGELIAHGLDWLRDEFEQFVTSLGEPARSIAIEGLSAVLESEDPIPPRHYLWLQYQATIRALIPTVKLILSGLGAWHSDPLLECGRATFGREFVYRLLFLVNPRTAVELGARLGDPAVLTAVEWLYDRGVDQNPGLVRSLLGSKSPFLRALAAQAVASHGSPRWGKYTPQPPVSVEATLAVLQEQQVPDADCAMYGLLWAVGEARTHPGLRTMPVLIQSLVALSSSEDKLANCKWVIAAMVSEYRRVLSPIFFEACLKLPPSTRKRIYLLIFEQMKEFCSPARIGGEYSIDLPEEFMFIQTVAQLLCDWASLSNESALDLADRYTCFQDLWRQIESATPLRMHDASKRAANRLLWSRFLRVIIANSLQQYDVLRVECQQFFEFLDFCFPYGVWFHDSSIDWILQYMIACMLRGPAVLDVSIALFVENSYVPGLAMVAASVVLGREDLAGSYLDEELQGNGDVRNPNMALGYLMLAAIAARQQSPLLDKLTLLLDRIRGAAPDHTELTRQVCKLRNEGRDDEVQPLVQGSQTWLDCFAWKHRRPEPCASPELGSSSQ